jgi:hypothetical protein
MSNFLSGLMSVGTELGRTASDWAEGTRVGKDIDSVRKDKNPWFHSGKSGAPSQGKNLVPPTEGGSVGS